MGRAIPVSSMCVWQAMYSGSVGTTWVESFASHLVGSLWSRKMNLLRGWSTEMERGREAEMVGGSNGGGMVGRSKGGWVSNRII